MSWKTFETRCKNEVRLLQCKIKYIVCIWIVEILDIWSNLFPRYLIRMSYPSSWEITHQMLRHRLRWLHKLNFPFCMIQKFKSCPEYRAGHVYSLDMCFLSPPTRYLPSDKMLRLVILLRLVLQWKRSKVIYRIMYKDKIKP